MESTRAQEAAVKKETTEQLDAFRRQQEEAERAAKQAGSPDAPEPAEKDSWSVGKKRKKGKESLFGAVKLRKSSTTEKAEPNAPTMDKPEMATSPKAQGGSSARTSDAPKADDTANAANLKSSSNGDTATKPAGSSVGLGLAAYSSDEDD